VALASPPSDHDFSGTTRFEVLARIGAGGMGVVYKALDKDRNARIALKTLRTLSADGILRFKNEFRALQDLQHPNLVNLGELIFETGQWFFTMELVDGVDFLTWVRPVLGYGTPTGDFALHASAPNAVTTPPEGGPVAYEARALEAMRPELDEPRLRAGLTQLARGLTALHAAQKVHRDIKPSNILVTGDGRVVLLDFGLATEVGASAHSDVNVVGTADYMAPEQAASRPAGPPADWYSVGVLLYEALTGTLPFSGAPLEVLIAKQRRDPLPPSSTREVSHELAQLCMALLQRDPAARPSGADVLARLGERDARDVRPTAPEAKAPFIGRARELEQLSNAFAATREGRPMTVLVQGESGVGKTVLVKRWTERLRQETRGVVVLSGRCYERESVPYKALDGVVDALARWLVRLPKAEVASLLPLRAALLAQAFPVLERVEAVRESQARVNAADPKELRQRVFTALRELFARVVERHPLALVIDDLQWADADSLALLGEILHPPDAPALLLVATVRPPKPGAGPLPVSLPGDVRTISVDRLPPDEARQLVTILVANGGKQALGDSDARAIADEARGHPLFIDELVRHAGEAREPGRLLLEDALWARVRQLDPAERHLLALAAMAGTPLALQVAARAIAPDDDDPDASEVTRHAALLRGGNLVRTVRGRDDTIEPYHDRVRAAVLGHLEGEQLRQLHAELARAYEQIGGDPETLATHFQGAGDRVRAASYAARAATDAARARSRSSAPRGSFASRCSSRRTAPSRSSARSASPNRSRPSAAVVRRPCASSRPPSSRPQPSRSTSSVARPSSSSRPVTSTKDWRACAPCSTPSG
jgi:serine/threonine protein kinase